MSAGVGEVSSSGTPIPQPHTPEKPSLQNPCDSLSRLALDSPSPIPIPAQEEEAEEEKKRKRDSTAAREKQAIPGLVAREGLPQEGAAESLGGGGHELKKAMEAGGGGGDENDSDSDGDGYCTPTSPRHMIPPPLTCPPAPTRKPAPKRRWPERRPRAVRRRLRLLDEVVAEFCLAGDGDPAPPPRIEKDVLVRHR